MLQQDRTADPADQQNRGIMLREEASYHFGSISRETAEQVLLDHGAMDGLFLVRDSSATDSVLSLCHNQR